MRMDFGGELRHGPGFHERSAHRITHKIMHHALLSEPDLGFRRMDIDVNFGAGQLKKQQHDGKTVGGRMLR